MSGDVLHPRPGIAVRTASLNHPGGCIGYRVEALGRVVAVISDTEHEPGTLDAAVLGLIENADLVIYDCTYTEEEMPYPARFRPFHVAAGRQAVRSGWRLEASRSSITTRHERMPNSRSSSGAQSSAIRRAFAAHDGQTLDIPRRTQA